LSHPQGRSALVDGRLYDFAVSAETDLILEPRRPPSGKLT
jgi:hypothetical protein